MLLNQLAQNLIVWTRNKLELVMPKLKGFGMLRMVRDVFHILGELRFDSHGSLLEVTLNEAKPTGNSLCFKPCPRWKLSLICAKFR